MTDSKGTGVRPQWPQLVAVAQIFTAVAAVAALVVTVVLTNTANRTAIAALDVAKDAQALSESAAEKALAIKFYIGSVPPGKSQAEDISEMGVINSSSVDMYEVVVFGVVRRTTNLSEDADPRGSRSFGYRTTTTRERINLSAFPACTGYTFPEEFKVEYVFFFDGITYWLRHRDGRLEKSEMQEYLASSPSKSSEDYHYKSAKDLVTFEALSCS